MSKTKKILLLVIIFAGLYAIKNGVLNKSAADELTVKSENNSMTNEYTKTNSEVENSELSAPSENYRLIFLNDELKGKSFGIREGDSLPEEKSIELSKQFNETIKNSTRMHNQLRDENIVSLYPEQNSEYANVTSLKDNDKMIRSIVEAYLLYNEIDISLLEVEYELITEEEYKNLYKDNKDN